MPENSASLPKPQWMDHEKERLSNLDNKVPPRPKRPTTEETALKQLKSYVIKNHLDSDPKLVPDSFDGPDKVNRETIHRIIEKVNRI